MAALVALHHQGPEDTGFPAQRHAQPVQGEGAIGLDLALGFELQEGRLIQQERLPDAEEVFREAASQGLGVRPGIHLIHPVGERDRVALLVPQGHVEVLGGHEVPHDAVDHGEELLGVAGLDGGLGDAVGGPLGQLRLVADRDVLGDGHHDLLAPVEAWIEPELLGEDLAALAQAPELEGLGLPGQGLPEGLAEPLEVIPARGGEDHGQLADEEVLRVAVHAGGALVHLQKAPLGVLDVDGFRDRVQHALG